jgi:hypothetical protein
MILKGVRYQLSIYSKNVLIFRQEQKKNCIPLVINVSFLIKRDSVFYFLTTFFQNGVQRYILRSHDASEHPNILRESKPGPTLSLQNLICLRFRKRFNSFNRGEWQNLELET